MKKTFILYYFIFGFSSSLAFAQPKFLDKLNNYTLNAGPGLAYIIIKGGKTVRSGAFGFSDLAKKVPITLESQFLIGSLAKQMTAMAILILEKEGRINEDDFAIKYLPELPKYTASIKIRHLLHHQSGLPDYAGLCENSKVPIGNNEILESLKNYKENKFEPGTKYLYSNTGYVILAEIISKISGQKFSDFMEQQIFKKTGMNKTYILTRENEKDFQNKMHSYTFWPHFDLDDNNPCNYKQGPGTVVTNLEDYSKWIAAIENNSLISDVLTKKMFTAGTLENGEATNYADGWIIDKFKKQKFINHIGSWLSFKSFSGYLPESKIWVTIFSNYGELNIYALGEEFLNLAVSEN